MLIHPRVCEKGLHMSIDNNNIKTKRCTKCGEVKPATDEHWHKNKTGKYGFRGTCKLCKSQQDHDHYVANSARYKKNARNRYYANREEIIAQQRIYRAKNAEHIRMMNKLYHQKNREARIQANRNYRLNHPDAFRRYRDDWRRKNPDKVAQCHADYQLRHRDRIRKASRDYARSHRAEKRIQLKRWRQNNPERVKAAKARRRAREQLAEGTFTCDDIWSIFVSQGECCAYCNKKLYWGVRRSITIDHIVPLSRGGTNYPENIALACLSCNSGKCDKTLDEWKSIRGW